MILAITILYLITAGLCVRAALYPARAPERSSRGVWLTISVLFVGLAVWRATGAEEALRSALRAAILARGGYGVRHAVQAPLASMVLLALAALGAWGALRLRKRGPRGFERAVFWAKAGTLAMAGLVAVRLISLHSTDLLLYSGPHLNRAIDPALTVFVGFQALLFVRHAEQAARR